MIQTPDGQKTSLRREDVIRFEKKGRGNRIFIYRGGKPLLINGKEYFAFPRAKDVREQFEWMCWFADAVGAVSLVRFGPPDQVIVADSPTASRDFLKE